MKEQEEIKTVFGIALIYTVITSIFSFLNNINTLLIGAHEIPNLRIYYFIRKSTLWVIFVAAIIIILIKNLKKSNQKVSTLMSDNPMIVLAAGVLVVIKGVSDLARAIPNGIVNMEIRLNSLRGTIYLVPEYRGRDILKAAVTNTVPAVLALFLTISGIILIKVCKKRITTHVRKDSDK